ncbi:hypothetical protein L6R53_21480 [Myxococcota bacterium]|nr:hypothetical protein [Myxococcota bacterium]
MHITMLGLAMSAGPLGCGDKGDDSGGVDANIVLTDAHNFSYTGEVTVPSIVTASGQDLTICWDQITQDIQCHDIDPLADLDNIGLARFPHKTQAEVETGLELNSLLQADIDGYVEWNTDHESGCVQLSAFSFFGTPIDVPSQYVDDGSTYMLMLTEGLEPGVGARIITFLEPQAESDVTDVTVPDSCGILDFTATLEDLTPLEVPASGPFVVDWSALTQDGVGADLLLENIDRLMVAFYEGQTPTDLQSQFLDLEIITSATYELELPGGTTADLADATGASGAFPGFSGDGTWLLALFCSRCYNPAPVFLTVVSPTE